MPKLQYPAYFEGDLLGAKVTEDIEHREAFIFVPYKMLITTGKAKVHPVLKKIIAENPEAFSQEGNPDWEQMTLVLFLIYEATIGVESYWFPYLRQMPDVEFTSQWTRDELMESQDIYFYNGLWEEHRELNQEWNLMKDVMSKYPDIFVNHIDKGFFYNVYA